MWIESEYGGLKREVLGSEMNVRSLSVRLAICVVFYDNYKYGHKALCLELLDRLSKLSRRNLDDFLALRILTRIIGPRLGLKYAGIKLNFFYLYTNAPVKNLSRK